MATHLIFWVCVKSAGKKPDATSKQIRRPFLALVCNTRYKQIMISNLYKSKGWVVKSFKIGKSSIQIELGIDARCRFCCPKCHASTISHSYRNISVVIFPLHLFPSFCSAESFSACAPNAEGIILFVPMESMRRWGLHGG